MTTAFLRTFGAGPVPVFALHCSLAHSGAWAGVAQYLDPVVTLKAMDLPGHGQSPMPARPEATADEAVEWVLQTLETPCHLFGHSFGAYIALRVALEAPERVSDGSGGYVEGWIVLGTLWAEITARTGRETSHGGAPCFVRSMLASSRTSSLV